MKFQVSTVKFQVACAEPGSSAIGVLRFATRRAFTLVELLVVISILGLLAALTVPALKNIGKSQSATSAAQQLLDDVGRARQLAISQHTTIYMVFLTTNFWAPLDFTSLTAGQKSLVTNLSASQLSGYAFISQGKLGDQPGQRVNNWEYHGTWSSLPDNNFIAAWKFILPTGWKTSVNGQFSVSSFSRAAVPFPTASNATVSLPFIAFNYLGQLTTNGLDASYLDEYIPLAQGSVAYGIDPKTKVPTMTSVGSSAIQETPANSSTSSTFTLIHVDALTGRARLEFQKVQ